MIDPALEREKSLSAFAKAYVDMRDNNAVGFMILFEEDMVQIGPMSSCRFLSHKLEKIEVMEIMAAMLESFLSEDDGDD
jgi:hypothetical protein